jgi:hypothetical protein
MNPMKRLTLKKKPENAEMSSWGSTELILLVCMYLSSPSKIIEAADGVEN